MMFNCSGEDNETTIKHERLLHSNAHNFLPAELASSPNALKNTAMFPSQHEESSRKNCIAQSHTLMNHLGMTGENKRTYDSRVMMPNMVGKVVSPNICSSSPNKVHDMTKHQDKKRRVSLNNDYEERRVNNPDPELSVKAQSYSKEEFKMKAEANLREFLINLSKCERSDRDYLVDNLIAGVKHAFQSTTASCQSSDNDRNTLTQALKRKDSIRGGKQYQNMLIRLDSRSNAHDGTQSCVITAEAPTASSPTTSVTVSASIPVNVPSRDTFSPDRCERSTFEVAMNQEVERDTIRPFNFNCDKTRDRVHSPDSVSSHSTFSPERSEKSAFEVGVKQELGQDLIRPNDNDVIGGRGNGPKNHDGNVAFRNLVQKYKIDYINAYTSKDKRSIVRQIISEVRQRGGRFLRKEYSDKAVKWAEMDDNSIMIKVAQALRENAPDLKRKHGTSPQYQLDAVSALMSLGGK